MRIAVNKIFEVCVSLCVALMFLFAGPIQFFIGIPSTLYSLVVLGIMVMIVAFNIIWTRRVILFPILFLSLIYILLIFLSGIYNSTEIFKILLYLNFALTPLVTVYLIKIFERQKVDYKKSFLAKMLRFIVIIQLPIVLIQKYGYLFLIKFSNANQSIAQVDFSFGTFPLKADHALGFFLLIYILSFFFYKRNKQQGNLPWFLISYCTITIFVMESNLTKVILLFCYLFFLMQWLYKRISIFGFIAILIIGLVVFNSAVRIPAVNSELYHIKNEFTPQKSLEAVNGGYAKRPQVLLYLLSNEPFKIIGHGPYNYYNIMKGEFKKTTHFSQIIWTYNDLGVFGVIIIILISISLIRFFSLDTKSSLLLWFVLLLYMFMTNVFSEITMLLSFLIINVQKRYLNE